MVGLIGTVEKYKQKFILFQFTMGKSTYDVILFGRSCRDGSNIALLVGSGTCPSLLVGQYSTLSLLVVHTRMTSRGKSFSYVETGESTIRHLTFGYR